MNVPGMAYFYLVIFLATLFYLPRAIWTQRWEQVHGAIILLPSLAMVLSAYLQPCAVSQLCLGSL